MKIKQVNKYLGECIEEVLEETKGNKKLLLNSPMRSGKTTSIPMIKNYFKKTYPNIKMVVISPKKALLMMLANDLGYDKVYGEFPFEKYIVTEKDVITTADSSYKVFDELNERKIPYVVVYDEIHSMYFNSSFRKKLTIPRSYTNSKNMIKYIGLTATGEDIPKEEFEDIFKVKPKEQWKFTDEIEIIDYQGDNIINRTLLELKLGLEIYEQVILRVNDIKILEEIKKGLESMEIKSLLFSSNELKNNKELINYIKREEITHDVILTTSTTDEGVELLTHSKNVLLISIFDKRSNPVDIIQQFGRYRNGTKKCKILCNSFAEGSPFEERKKKLDIVTKYFLEFSKENGETYNSKYITQQENGEYKIKDIIILEECIKADLQYKVNDINKLVSYFKKHDLIKGIKITKKYSRDKSYNSKIKEIENNIIDKRTREKEEKENERKTLNKFMVKELPNLDKNIQKIFFTPPSCIRENEENTLEELEQYYNNYWSKENKEKRKEYYDLFKQNYPNEDLTAEKELLKYIYTDKKYKEYKKFLELREIRALSLEQIKRIEKDIKYFDEEFTRPQRKAILIRYVLREKEKKRGRITGKELNEIKEILFEKQLLTPSELENNEIFLKKTTNIIKNLYVLVKNNNNISCIKKKI